MTEYSTDNDYQVILTLSPTPSDGSARTAPENAETTPFSGNFGGFSAVFEAFLGSSRKPSTPLPKKVIFFHYRPIEIYGFLTLF
jgi:hypothetical protein